MDTPLHYELMVLGSDLDHRITHFNQLMNDNFLHQRENLNRVGEKIEDSFKNKDLALRLAKRLDYVINTGLPAYRSVDIGGKIWKEECVPAYDPKGKIIGATTVYRFLILSSNGEQETQSFDKLILTLDKDFKIINAYGKWSSLLGINSHDILGLNPTKLIHPDEVKILREALKEISEEKVNYLKLELSFRSFEGEYSHTHSVLFEDHESKHIHIVSRFIDEEFKVVEKLEETLSRYKTMAKFGNIGLYDWKINSDYVFFSHQWKEQLGYEDHEIEPNYREFQKRVHPDDLSELLDKINTFITNPKSTYKAQFRMRHKDGSYRWILTEANLVRDSNNQPYRMLGAHIDITELKEYQLAIKSANEELSKNSKLLETINKHSMVGTWEVDLENMKVWWSDEVKIIHEVDPDYECDVENAIYFYKEGDSRNTISQVFEHAIKTGDSYDVELEIVTHKKNIRWVRTIGIPAMEGDQCKTIYGTFQDITEYKLSQIELEKMSLVASKITNGVVITNHDRLVNWTNDAFTQLTQFKQEEILGLSLRKFLLGPNSDLDTIKSIDENAAKGLPFDTDILLYRKDKSEFWVDITITPVKNNLGEITHFINIITDITERKNAEIQAKQNEERITHIANSVPGVLLVYKLNTDNTDELLFISDGIAPLWGIPKANVLKDVNEIWKLIHEDDLLDLQKSVIDSAENLTFWDHVYRTKLKSGKIKWINGRGFPERQPDGSTIWVSMLIDITELKETQNKLREQQSSLENALNEKNTLFKELHHRIKNNLQLISSILFLKSKIDYDAGTLEFIQETNNRIKSISKIHNQLLSMEEVDHLNISDYLSSLIKDLVDSMAPRNSAYSLNLDIERHRIKIDVALSLGLITNEVISNTLKYAYPNSDGGPINVTLKKKKDTIYLELADEGCGKISDLSFDNSKSLGLTLINTLVAQISGKLTMDFTSGVKYAIEFEDKK